MLWRANQRYLRSQRTWTTKHHGILGVFSAHFVHRLVHWDESSISDRARKDRMGRNIAFSEEELARDAVDAVRTNDSICGCGRAILEMEDYATAFFVLNGLEAFVEVRTFSRHSLDETIQKLRAVYALHAAWSLLGTDHLTVLFAFALMKKDVLAKIRYYPRRSSRGLGRFHLLQHTQ